MDVSQFLILFELQFLDSLVELDAVEAKRVQGRGCLFCGGKLDRADYGRKPRGIKGLCRRHRRRQSFCCRRCRKRRTPASALFLGRKVYLGIAVIIVSYLRERREGVLLRRLASLSGASEVTIRRWLRWWDESVSTSDFWKALRSHFMPPLEELRLIVLLAERFRSSCNNLSETFRGLCRFLSPLTIPAEYPC